MSDYDDILFLELLGGNHIKKADKIFKESYRLSRIGEGSGDFQSYNQLNIKLLNNFQLLSRWIDLIDEIYYKGKKDENIS